MPLKVRTDEKPLIPALVAMDWGLILKDNLCVSIPCGSIICVRFDGYNLSRVSQHPVIIECKCTDNIVKSYRTPSSFMEC